MSKDSILVQIQKHFCAILLAFTQLFSHSKLMVIFSHDSQLVRQLDAYPVAISSFVQ